MHVVLPYYSTVTFILNMSSLIDRDKHFEWFFLFHLWVNLCSIDEYVQITTVTSMKRMRARVFLTFNSAKISAWLSEFNRYFLSRYPSMHLLLQDHQLIKISRFLNALRRVSIEPLNGKKHFFALIAFSLIILIIDSEIVFWFVDAFSRSFYGFFIAALYCPYRSFKCSSDVRVTPIQIWTKIWASEAFFIRIWKSTNSVSFPVLFIALRITLWNRKCRVKVCSSSDCSPSERPYLFRDTTGPRRNIRHSTRLRKREHDEQPNFRILHAHQQVLCERYGRRSNQRGEYDWSGEVDW